MMSNFAELMNDIPMDPTDARFFFGIDLVDVVDDAGTIVNPTATIDAAGIAAGVTLNDVAISNSTQVTFRPTVSGAEQNNARWNGNGQKFLVAITIEDAFARKIERSARLWIAQR